jgi:hypothetical protein
MIGGDNPIFLTAKPKIENLLSRAGARRKDWETEVGRIRNTDSMMMLSEKMSELKCLVRK